MVFYDWVTAGFAFGIEAFFAIVAFGLCCAALYGIGYAVLIAIGITSKD